MESLPCFESIGYYYVTIRRPVHLHYTFRLWSYCSIWFSKGYGGGLGLPATSYVLAAQPSVVQHWAPIKSIISGSIISDNHVLKWSRLTDSPTPDTVYPRPPRFGPAPAAPVGQGVVQIPLVNGGSMTVDDCDGHFALRKWWRLDSRNTSYAYTRVSGRRGYAHAYIAGQEFLCESGRAIGVVDHIDGNGLNNTRANLRTCSNRDNVRAGVGRRAARRSRYKGVSPASGTNAGKWRATIHLPGSRQVHLGYFRNEETAARVYDAAAREHFGEFAFQNFPHGE